MADDLSNEILLHIFSYLDDSSLLNAAQVCSTWRFLSEDHLFWWARLQIMRAHQGSFCSCPGPRQLGQCPLKTLYYRKTRAHRRDQPTCPASPCSQATRLSYLLPGRKPLKVVLFGPGLEGGAAGLVSDLMWGPQSPFETLGMFPSSHAGLGGGIRMRLRGLAAGSGHHWPELNLVTLYRASQREREALSALSAALPGSQRRLNKFLDSEEVLRRSLSVASSADAFIYICDNQIPLGREIAREFEALVGAGAPGAPVLLLMPTNQRPMSREEEAEVLASYGGQRLASVTASDYVDFLNLPLLRRKWCLYSCDFLEGSKGLSGGIEWLFGPPSSWADLSGLTAGSAAAASRFTNWISSSLQLYA